MYVKRTYQFITQCRGDISHAFNTAKITVFDPMMCMYRCALTRRALVLITCSKCDMWPTCIASIEGWLVLTWLVRQPDVRLNALRFTVELFFFFA